MSENETKRGEETAIVEAPKREKGVKVDMLDAARNAQWSADTFLGVGSIKLVAPAKVNLFLGVGESRADGYHEVTNVMHAVALHDVMYVHKGWVDPKELSSAQEKDAAGDLPRHLALGGPEKNLLVTIDCADKAGAGALDISTSENIVFNAIDRLAHACGHAEPEKISIRIEKNIPHQGGLGGGSSDAAAMLVALSHLWGVADDDPRFIEVAQNLGADVAFFLQGGCALFTGAGEIFEHKLDAMKNPVVLVKPTAGVSTSEAYRAFDENPVAIPGDLAAAAQAAEAAEDVPLFNSLAPAAEQLVPELADVRTWLAGQPGVRGEQDVLLCGSGATTFAFVDDFAAACNIAAAAQARGWWARATVLSSLRAARVPQR